MRPIKLSKKEWGLAVAAVALALASTRPTDPWVVGPMLGLSWAAFIYLAYHHRGSLKHKLLFAGIATIILCFIGYRDLRSNVTPASAGTLSAFTILSSTDGVVPQIEIGSSGVIFTPTIPGDGPRPELLIGKIFVGAGQYALGSLKPILSDCDMRIESIKGRVKLSLSLLDANGDVVARLNRNEWDWSGRPVSFDRNYSQDSIEVQDKSGHIVLQVTALPDRVRLQLVCFRQNGKLAYLVQVKQFPTGARDALISFNNTANDDLRTIIKPMFQYPSSLHLGELVETR